MTELVLKAVTREEVGGGSEAGRRVSVSLSHPNTVGARDRCGGLLRALPSYLSCYIALWFPLQIWKELILCGTSSQPLSLLLSAVWS